MNIVHYQEVLERCGYTCIAYTKQHRYYAKENGIRPIMINVKKDPYFFQDHILVDRLIGKAVAMLLVRSKVAYVHGVVMSKEAHMFLEKHGIHHSFGTLVPYIENRTHDGLCPMEASVKNIDDVEEAYVALCKTIDTLMHMKSKRD